jgi:hypothetical protein
MEEEPKVGIIHEIGDMGLGFDELTESDAKLYKENEEKKKDLKK